MAASTYYDAQEHIFSYGIVALLSASLLLPFGLSYPTQYDPRREPRAAAWEYLSDHYLIAHLVLSLALVLLAVGLFTLHSYVLRRHIASRGSVITGMLASLIGIILLVSGVSVRGLALREYAQVYVLMDHESLTWFNLEAFGNNSGFLGNLFLTIGSGWLMRGVQETHDFPRWTVFAYLIGMILIVLAGGIVFSRGLLGYGSTGQIIRIVGGVLIASAGSVWAWHMWQTKTTFRATDLSFVQPT